MKKVAIGFALLVALAIGMLIGHSLGEPTSKAIVARKTVETVPYSATPSTVQGVTVLKPPPIPTGSVYYVIDGQGAGTRRVRIDSACWRDARIGLPLPRSCQ